MSTYGASAQTYTFSNAGSDELWSNPANWSDGIVPVSSPNASIINPGGSNDLSGLSIGELVITDNTWGGQRVTLTSRLVFDTLANVPGVPFEYMSPIRLEGNVAIEALGYGPSDNETRSNDQTPVILDLELAGHATVDGNLEIRGISGMGRLQIVEGAALHGMNAVSSWVDVSNKAVFSEVEVDGIVTGGDFDLGGTGTMDTTGGVLALGTGANTLGIAFSRGLSVNGNLLLGEWANGGGSGSLDPFNGPSPFERIEVSATLDLTQSNLLYDSVGVDWDPWASPGLPSLVEDSYVIATYGNRLGELPQERLDLAIGKEGFGGFTIPGHIVYTSDENSGPGEILVLLPEPGSVGIATVVGGLAMRRRR